MRRIVKAISPFMIFLAVHASITLPLNVFAAILDDDTILFYNPSQAATPCLEGGDLDAPGPTSLTGETNQEKVWNYLITRGLTAVAAAGALGNMLIEDPALDPWMGEVGGGGGFGIIQWTPATAMENGGYEKIKALESNKHDPKVIDQALLIELDALWVRGKNLWEHINTETQIIDQAWYDTLKPDTAQVNSLVRQTWVNNQYGSVMDFHQAIERSGDTVRTKIPNYGVFTKRIDAAHKTLEHFTSETSSSICGDDALSSEINALALQLAWPNKLTNYTTEAYIPTPAYSAAMTEAGTGDINNGCVHTMSTGGSAGDSCDRFVSTVYRLTVDSNIPAGNVGTIYNYIVKNSDKYTEVNKDDIRGGDILIYRSKAHIMLVAQLEDGTMSIVDASCGQRTASVRHHMDISDNYIFRWVGGGQ